MGASERNETETAVNVEWWDAVTGAWADLGEAVDANAARWRIAGLRAADVAPVRYRIVTTVTETFEPGEGGDDV